MMTAIRPTSVDQMACVLLYHPRVRNRLAFPEGTISVIFISDVLQMTIDIIAAIA